MARPEKAGKVPPLHPRKSGRAWAKRTKGSSLAEPAVQKAGCWPQQGAGARQPGRDWQESAGDEARGLGKKQVESLGRCGEEASPPDPRVQ